MRPIVDHVRDEIEALGGVVDRVWMGRHWRMRWRLGNDLFTETVAVSPSDYRALIQARGSIRRKAKAATERTSS